MRIIIFLLGSCLATLLSVISDAAECDTKWIRVAFMISCGKKKRESGPPRNITLLEPLPRDIDGVIQYFRDRDPQNPVFDDEEEWLAHFLRQEDNKVRKVDPRTRNQNVTALHENGKKNQSTLLKRILPRPEENSMGIPGFPNQWNVEELSDNKVNENHRRNINELIAECCKNPPASHCNGNNFLGACK